MSTSPGLIPLIALVGGFVANYLFQRGRSSQYDYKCEKCGETFSLPPLAGAIAPHRPGGRKWVRCPRCGAFSWTTPVSKG